MAKNSKLYNVFEVLWQHITNALDQKADKNEATTTVTDDGEGNLVFTNVAVEEGAIVEEVDPTVPDWAKQPNKPDYTWGDINDKPFTDGKLNPECLPDNISSGNADTLDGQHATAFKQTWNVPAGGSYVGWIQLIKLPSTSDGTLDIKPFTFNIYRNYTNPASESYTLSIHAVQGVASITQLSGNYKERIIEKFRIAKKSNNMYYLEMYVNTSYTTQSNRCDCCISDYYSFNGQLISTVSTETPSDVLCELTTGAGFYSTDPMVANSDTDYNFSRVRNISAGTADLTAGTSTLANGSIYLVYE